MKAPVDPVDWFLAGKDDVRSSYYQIYQKNAYRVLLTRARQGMVLIKPVTPLSGSPAMLFLWSMFKVTICDLKQGGNPVNQA